MSIHNIHVEGTVSQNYDKGPGFIFIQKKGEILIIYFIVIFLDFII